jgi:DUF971 family protein
VLAALTFSQAIAFVRKYATTIDTHRMPHPIEIKLKKNEALLEVRYDNGDFFALAAEYLRVYSPSAEVQGHGPGQRTWPRGKSAVNIKAIHPVGNYAVVLEFDDGHNTGIYSWKTLHELGVNRDANWQLYLDILRQPA